MTFAGRRWRRHMMMVFTSCWILALEHAPNVLPRFETFPFTFCKFKQKKKKKENNLKFFFLNCCISETNLQKWYFLRLKKTKKKQNRKCYFWLLWNFLMRTERHRFVQLRFGAVPSFLICCCCFVPSTPLDGPSPRLTPLLLHTQLNRTGFLKIN